MVSQNPIKKQIKHELVKRALSGTKFVKSHHIAKEVGVSAKQVGQVMYKFEAKEQVTLNQYSISLQRWGGKSDGITWYINILERGR